MTQPRRVPITLPELGDPRAVFSLWYVRPGDRVFEGDRVAEVLIPGATFDVLADLRAIRCDVITMGQYLAPTLKHSIPVARYVPPAEFDEIAARARLMGFRQVVAGPFVRSSYHADEMVPARE